MPVADTILKRLDNIINWVTLLVVILLALIAWSIGSTILSFFKSTAEFETFRMSRVEGFDANDQLVTSIAGVDMLWVTYPESGKNRREYSLIQVLDRQIADQELRDAIYPPDGEVSAEINKFGYCVHSYEIAFGYPSFADFQSSLESQVAARVSAGDAVNASTGFRVPPPEILALNPLGSQVQPPVNTDDCMRKNTEGNQRATLKQEIWAVLARDRVQQVHIKQAQFAAVTLVDAISGACAPKLDPQSTEPAEPQPDAETSDGVCWRDLLREAWEQSDKTVQASQEKLEILLAQSAWLEANVALEDAAMENLSLVSAQFDSVEPAVIEEFDVSNFTAQAQSLADSIAATDQQLRGWAAEESALLADAAGLGAIQVTISTLFGMDTAWRPWYWADQEGIYLQRDVTSIVYGSSIAPTEIRPPRPFAGDATATVRLKPPSELSRDRRTSFVMQTGNSAAWEKGAGKTVKENLGSFVTRSINESVNSVERRVRHRALDSAEAMLRNRVTNWFDGEVIIEFEDSDDPLLFELRDWIDQQGFAVPANQP